MPRRAVARRGRLSLALRRGAARVALLACVAAGDALAQASADAPRTAEGRVVRGAGRGRLTPVAGHWVTLHRVGRDSAGPLDSARTRADGGYAFRWRPFGDSAALYFVSSSYHGIAYFTPPFRDGAATGDDTELVVYDTTSRAIPLVVQGHHIVLATPDSSRRRRVIEVFELSNDSSVTRVAVGNERPTWARRLPRGARDVRAGEGDVSPEAVVERDGEVRVFAPFAPGLKQVSYAYTLPVDAFPLDVPVLDATGVLEVLLEEPQASASGATLREVEPAEAEGRQFRRYLAQDVPANAVLRIQAPSPASRGGGRYVPVLLLSLGAVMLYALTRSLTRRAVRRPEGAHPHPAGESPERLAQAIVDLDAGWRRQPASSAEAEARYRARRDSLKARLNAAIARRDAAR
jgi:hypothetical protein